MSNHWWFFFLLPEVYFSHLLFISFILFLLHQPNPGLSDISFLFSIRINEKCNFYPGKPLQSLFLCSFVPHFTESWIQKFQVSTAILLFSPFAISLFPFPLLLPHFSVNMLKFSFPEFLIYNRTLRIHVDFSTSISEDMAVIALAKVPGEVSIPWLKGCDPPWINPFSKE